MNGKAHLLSALFVLAPLLAAFALQGVISLPEALLVAVGITLGLAAPDVDSNNGLERPHLAYREKAPLYALADDLNSWVSWLFYTVSKWFFYKPLVLFVEYAGYRRVSRHRGVMHSLFAALLCTCFWMVLLLALCSVVGWGTHPAFVLGAGLLLGFMFHLYADSLTPAGVNWFFPHKLVLNGRIRTDRPLYGKGVKFLDSQLFALILFALVGLITLWMLANSNANAYFLAFLSAFCLMIASVLMGLEVSVDDSSWAGPRASSIHDFEFE